MKRYQFTVEARLTFDWDGENQADAEKDFRAFLETYHRFPDSMLHAVNGFEVDPDDFRAVAPSDPHVERFHVVRIVHPEYVEETNYLRHQKHLEKYAKSAVLHVKTITFHGIGASSRFEERWEIWREGKQSELFFDREGYYERMKELEWEVEDVAS